MNNKTKKPKTKSKDEERFYQFAKALIAVPKSEIDEQASKDKHPKQSKKRD